MKSNNSYKRYQNLHTNKSKRLDLDQFMTENYTELQTAAQKITGGDELWEELLHYCLEEFLFKPNVNEIIESGGGRFYVVRIMLNQFRSTTSPFYTKYRTPTEDITDQFGEEPEVFQDHTDNLTKIQDALAQLSWYDKMLFEIFVKENHTISSLSRATGIPRTSVNLTINRVRTYLKKALNAKI